ncbi:hypothetical protein BRCON_2836 [Candidatus Sumerlaea chitinivorans]|uniref:Uncharacterized protein n=1 Tax=Sumerlaea chitinivorans TaxID=2250252 RepID=A0A2Z4Y9X3_SUMC1|nr:hypothetical protein BRCON_2836 [Candidatus Sumerlaea chitinivorans]
MKPQRCGKRSRRPPPDWCTVLVKIAHVGIRGDTGIARATKDEQMFIVRARGNE